MIVAKEAVKNCREDFHIIENAIKGAALGQRSNEEHEWCWAIDHCVPQEVMAFIVTVKFDTDAAILVPKISLKLRHGILFVFYSIHK